MGREFAIDERTKKHVADQLAARSWEELEVLEHAGYLLFPEKLYKRKKDGSYEEKAVMLRVPRPPAHRKARIEARDAAVNEGLDPKFDGDLIDDLETFHLLAEAIRNNTEPFERWQTARELELNYDKSCLVQLWAKLDGLVQLVDPRPDDISPGEMIALMAKLVSEKNLGPLAVYGQGAQTFLVLTMAALSLSFLGSKSSSGSTEESTLESFLNEDSPN